MSFYSADHLRSLTGAQWLQRPGRDLEATALCIDSREDVAGKLFVAIRGGNHDGHDFIEQVAASGAVLAMVERPIHVRTLPSEIGVMRVDDTRRALGRIALAYRRRLRGTKVIAVTGSCGKTTTKRLIHDVLVTRLKGSAAPRSFNNEIGVPLSILAAKPGDDFLVVEIGMNQRGEISRLAAITEPDIAVITTVGQAHLESFGTVEAIAAEKASLLTHVRCGGIGIVNADVQPLRRHIRTLQNALLFGRSEDADLRVSAWGCDGESWFFEINGRTRYPLSLPGCHNAVNALAAVAIGRRFGLHEAEIAAALASAGAEPMRLNRRRFGSVTVYDDSYNASPESVQAAMDTFAELETEANRRVLILGDMLELGKAGPALHRSIGDRIVQLHAACRIDAVVAVGPLSKGYLDPLVMGFPPDSMQHFEKLNDRVLQSIEELLRPGDAVLVKASRGIGLDRVVSHLEERASSDTAMETAAAFNQPGGRDRAPASSK